MAKKDILKLMIGFRRFRERYFSNKASIYHRLSSGQEPKTLIIGCSDSRVDPAIITSAAPGEIFVVRNVANLVPPFTDDGGVHGVSAAIEFAVVNLKVENIIILGHRQCGGVRALMLNEGVTPSGFVANWVNIARPARERVMRNFPNLGEEELCRHGERESIVNSLENLKTFPFVREAIEQRGLTVIGIYFDLELGELTEYDDNLKDFRALGI